MTLFEIIIICVVAAMFVATIFMFSIYIQNIKKLHVLESKITTMSNVAFECRSFLEKLSKHDVIVKINNINGLEKKVGELLSICKNQTNNITQVRDTLNESLEDIKMRNNMIRDSHKLLDSINVKTNKMQDDVNKIGEIVADINKSNLNKYNKTVEDVTYIREKLGETSLDSEKYVSNIDNKLEDILSWTKRCKSGVEALVEGHNKGIDATRKAFEVINDTLSNIGDNIDNVIKNNKINNDEIAKISSILDQYREKVNYITKLIENATKLKTATKTKMAQSKVVRTPAKVKSMQ